MAVAAGRVVVGRRSSHRHSSPRVATVATGPAHAPEPLSRARAGSFGSSSGGEAAGCGLRARIMRAAQGPGKGAAGEGCEASGRVAGAGCARGAAEGVSRARTERPEWLASSQSPPAPPSGGRKSLLVRQRRRISLSDARLSVSGMGAVWGSMVWCGGMGGRGGPPPNVQLLEKVEACSKKTFVRCCCNGVAEQVGCT